VGLKLDFSKFIQEIFEREKDVIYVIVVNKLYKLLASDIRKDAEVYLPSQAFLNFAQITPPLVLDALERLEPALGRISAIFVRYQKRSLLFNRLGDDMAAILGLDSRAETPVLDRLAQVIEHAMEQSQQR